MNNPRTALVTGANKGIGLEITRQLARRGFRVFLGARDPGRGQSAVEQLQREEAKVDGTVEFLHLDVSDAASIARAAGELGERTGGRLDVLVNNAAILEDEPGEDVLGLDPARLARTLETNVYGPLRLTQAVADLLAAAGTPDGARVINLSSGLGQLHDMGGTYPAYSISKTALNALTRQLAAAFRQRGQAVSVNTMCPGWVKTDMGGAGADREVSQGADTAVWLATEASADLTGRSWRDRKEIPW